MVLTHCIVENRTSTQLHRDYKKGKYVCHSHSVHHRYICFDATAKLIYIVVGHAFKLYKTSTLNNNM